MGPMDAKGNAMHTTIRRATGEDADALTALAMLSKRSNGYDDAFMAACVPELRVTPAMLDAHAYWVAEDGAPCGFIGLRVDPDGTTGEVAALYIHPGRQGRGIGRMLWRELEGAARAQGIPSLRLDADPHAEAFYRGLGFVTVGRAPSGSIPGRTLPHMRIDLPGAG